jgi:TonB C terminal
VISDRKMEVGTWSESQQPFVAENSKSKRFWSPAFIGLVGTLILHSLALQTLVLGSRARAIRAPDMAKSESSLGEAETAPAENLVIVELTQAASADRELGSALAPVLALIKDRPVAVNIAVPPLSNIDVPPVDDDKASASSLDSGDGAETARLLGIYAGQIRARIERVWRRPRTPVNEGADPARSADAAEYFRCQVEIIQDPRGNVQEILLPHCRGSLAWQRSLLMAIRQASPIPAPPSPTVFSRTVTLEFVGYPFIAGAPEDNYESASAAPIQAAISRNSSTSAGAKVTQSN